MKSIRLTEDNLNTLRCGIYAIFVNNKIKDLRIIDRYAKTNKQTWDYYEEFGVISNKTLAKRYVNRKAYICNIKYIIMP